MTRIRISAVAGLALAAMLVLTLVCKKPVNSPPDTPAAPSGITSGDINTEYDFSAFTTDPDNDSVSYRFSWGDEDTSDWSAWVASGETATMSHSWTSLNIYQVSAQAKDVRDSISSWSNSLSVNIHGPIGTLKWRYQTVLQVFSSPAVAADGTIFVGSDDNCIHAINPDGTLKWRYQTDRWVSSSPAIATDGTVYVGSHDGYLYAVYGDSPLADSPWPKFHHDNQNTGRVGGP